MNSNIPLTCTITRRTIIIPLTTPPLPFEWGKGEKVKDRGGLERLRKIAGGGREIVEYTEIRREGRQVDRVRIKEREGMIYRE